MASAVLSESAAGPLRPSAWGLAPKVASETQALVATGFGWLPEGRALLLRADRDGCAWLRALRGVAPITDATPPPPGGKPSRAAAIAFTWSGLRRLGLPDQVLASFSRPFREGMFQPDRARRLGDRRFGEWQPTVVEGGPAWSGNPEPLPRTEAPRPYDVAFPVDAQEPEVRTRETVHALLLLYARTDADADDWAGAVRGALAEEGVIVVRALELEYNVLQRDRLSGVSREHFGFADGLSQPLPFDADGAVVLGDRSVTERDPVQGAPLGEFLLGFRNAYGELPPGPATPGDDPAAVMLPPHPEAQGFRDLGRHGSYLVVRELRQDVTAFWESMERAARRLRESDPANAATFTAKWIAERIVGRTVDGHVLCPGGARKPLDENGTPDNGFLFLADDRDGIGCPLGSHVRRGHPRDGLAASPDDAATLLRAANNHRILRRARKYGPAYDEARKEESGKAERGLLFACLNTDIARQFEFTQQTWLLNPDFAGLRDEVDPLVGPAGRLTLPADPFRHALRVETFVRLAGGEYFFLPGTRALEHFERLP